MKLYHKYHEFVAMVLLRVRITSLLPWYRYACASRVCCHGIVTSVHHEFVAMVLLRVCSTLNKLVIFCGIALYYGDNSSIL